MLNWFKRRPRPDDGSASDVDGSVPSSQDERPQDDHLNEPRGLAEEAGASGHAPQQPVDKEQIYFRQALMAAARSLAHRGDQRLIDVFDTQRAIEMPRPLKIGLFGNMANNSFIQARCLRRLGYSVDLILDSKSIDIHFLSQPYWEEIEIEVDNHADPAAPPSSYKLPDYVRPIDWDVEMAGKYCGRIEACDEVKSLYFEEFGRYIPDDVALILAQWMGFWNYIKAMNDYDIVQFCHFPIVLGMFCPRPYICLPVGGELMITSFEETVMGLSCRAGFRAASHTCVPLTDYLPLLDRIEIAAPRTILPLMVDTDVYKVAGAEDTCLRERWQAMVGGSRFALSVCRQSWEWKGSGRLLKAFADFFRAGGGEWRLLLQSWGDSLEESRRLIEELDIKHAVLWLPMCSKPLLRKRQRAADVVVDQFVMDGYGTSVVESMAAGKPVVMAPLRPEAASYFQTTLPPFIGAKSQDEIKTAFERLDDDEFRLSIGRQSRRWVEDEHGYTNLIERFDKMCKMTYFWNTIEAVRAHDGVSHRTRVG